MTKPGERVGAILGSKDGVVEFIGFGVYAGNEIPPADINPLLNIGMPNPKIVLDDGKVVWGCECWWGAESEVMKVLEANKVINVDIDEVRRRQD